MEYNTPLLQLKILKKFNVTDIERIVLIQAKISFMNDFQLLGLHIDAFIPFATIQ